jgi:multiple sugar transport system substrate-binding protein
MEYVQFPPVSSVQPAVDRAIQETIEAFYAGQMDVEQTVTMLADRIRAELAKQ